MFVCLFVILFICHPLPSGLAPQPRGYVANLALARECLYWNI